MKILEVKVYRGPNLYEYRPMIRMEVDLEEMEGYPTDKIAGFSDRLMGLVPTLAAYRFSSIFASCISFTLVWLDPMPIHETLKVSPMMRTQEISFAEFRQSL